jgi:UDP-N-acetylmuramate dehydrogenase
VSLTENIALKPFNTFGVAATARHWVSITRPEDVQVILDNPLLAEQPRLILGGGSNILFTRDFEGLIIKNDIRGIAVLKEDGQYVWVRAGAGEEWDAFVRWTLTHRCYGLENLSLIPGSVGASPVQNIGAYGVEVGDLLESVETIELATGEAHRFHVTECGLGYRTSIFKQSPRDRFIITAVTFRLFKTPRPVIAYADVARTFQKNGSVDPSPKALRDVVCRLRRRKLPDPAELGNAGSFFKNPLVVENRFAVLAAQHPKIPHFPQADGRIKIAAGWLIEKCGWKGRRMGACGVYPHQALVLVNYGGAQGAEILTLAQAIGADVKSLFGLDLEPEPRII